MRQLYATGDQPFGGLSPQMLGKRATVFRTGKNVVFDEEFATAEPQAIVRGPQGQVSGVFTDENLKNLSNQGRAVAGQIDTSIVVYTPNYLTTLFSRDDRSFASIDEVSLWGQFPVVVGKRPGEGGAPTQRSIYALEYDSNGLTLRPRVAQNNPDALALDYEPTADEPGYVISIHDNYMILGFNNQIFWSNAGTPEQWDVTRNITERDFHTPITALARQGAVTMVYTEDRIAALEYISGTLEFRLTPRLSAGGASGKDSIVTVGERHFGYSADGFFASSGFNYELLDDARIRGAIAQSSFTVKTPTASWHREHRNEVVWMFGNRGVIFNYRLKTWTEFVFENPVNGAIRIGETLISTKRGAVGGVSSHNGLFTDGRLGTWEMVTRFIDCGTTEHYKQLQAVEVTCDGSCTLKIEGTEEASPMRDEDWMTIETLNINEGSNFEYIPNTGAMFFRLTFSGNTDFRLSGFKLHGERGGMY